MKHMKWLALLTAIVMVLGMGAAMGKSRYTIITLQSVESGVTGGPSIGWGVVPWEDKNIKVTFGFHLSSQGENTYFYIDILEQGTDKWNDQYALLDDEYKALADKNSLMLLDIKYPKDNDEPLDLEGRTCSVYIQITEPWGGKKEDAFHFAYLTKEGDEPFGTALLTNPHGQKGEFLKVNAKHFSPFAAYAEKTFVPAPVAPPAGSVPSTGDQSAPAMWLALAAMSAAVVIGFGRKARKA